MKRKSTFKFIISTIFLFISSTDDPTTDLIKYCIETLFYFSELDNNTKKKHYDSEDLEE